MSGDFTSKLGEKIKKYLPIGDIKTYHDHGTLKTVSRKAVKLTFENVIKVQHENKISDADIVIVNEKDRTVLCLIEIEEKNTLTPKKLLGTICTFNLAKLVFIDQTSFKILKSTQFFICGQYNNNGHSKKKLNELKKVLESRLKYSREIDLILVEKIVESEVKILDYIKKNIVNNSA